MSSWSIKNDALYQVGKFALHNKVKQMTEKRNVFVIDNPRLKEEEGKSI